VKLCNWGRLSRPLALLVDVAILRNLNTGAGIGPAISRRMEP
jgi:hypothetical protein